MLCVQWGALVTLLPRIYSITNTKHCITYLALTQLFPLLLTIRFHIMKYTQYVAFGCVSFRSLSFTWDKWILLAAFLLDLFSKSTLEAFH